MNLIEKLQSRRRAAGEGGFTLIELLVVIIILAILAAVVVFAVGGVGDKGNKSACRIDTRTLRTAAEAHFAQFSDYTVPEASVDGKTKSGATVGPNLSEDTLVNRGFLSEVSELHRAVVYDSNGATAGVVPAIAIFVQDGTAPGNDCGNVDAEVGTCGGAPGAACGPGVDPDNF